MPKVSRCGQVVDEEALTFLQQKGVIDLRDIVFFAAFIAAWLYACALIVDARKAD